MVRVGWCPCQAWEGKAGLTLQPVDPCESRGWALPHTLYCLSADATVTPRACSEDPQLASCRGMGGAGSQGWWMCEGN